MLAGGSRKAWNLSLMTCRELDCLGSCILDSVCKMACLQWRVLDSVSWTPSLGGHVCGGVFCMP